MDTLILLKHLEKKTIIQRHFKNKVEAIFWWAHFPTSHEWEVIYLEERKPSGHRYELMYARFDRENMLYSKYIICFSKEEALYLEKKIKEKNQDYIIQIKKLY